MFEPGHDASVYTAQGLSGRGLERHAAFLVLRSQVARSKGSFQPYHDLPSAARFSPGHWVGSTVAFGLRHLIERLQGGEVPTHFPQDTGMSELRDHVSWAYAIAVQRDPAATESLRVLKDRLLELMPLD